MSDIADLLKEDELNLEQMAQVMGLPRSDFLRIFGDHDVIKYKTFADSKPVEYRFQLERREEKRYYLNRGYAPPLP